MKLALVFLLAFVALSCQQQLQKRMIWMSPYNPPRAYYNVPSFYDNRLHHPAGGPMGRYYFNQPLPNPLYYAGAIQQQQHPILQQLGSRYYHPNSYFSPPPPIIQDQMHHEIPLVLADDEKNNEIEFHQQQQPHNKQYPAAEPEGRIFLTNRYNGITLSTTSSNFLIKTKTVASLVQTTITSTSTLFCVPAIEFSGSAYQTTCSANGRRRRDVVSLLDMLEGMKRDNNDQDLLEEESIISPDQVEPLESSVAPSYGLFGTAGRMKKDLSAETTGIIESSQEPEDDADWDERRKRSFFGSIGGLFLVSSTVSITNCTTTVTTTTSTLTLGTSGAVTCLPSGLTTC